MNTNIIKLAGIILLAFLTGVGCKREEKKNLIQVDIPDGADTSDVLAAYQKATKIEEEKIRRGEREDPMRSLNTPKEPHKMGFFERLYPLYEFVIIVFLTCCIVGGVGVFGGFFYVVPMRANAGIAICILLAYYVFLRPDPKMFGFPGFILDQLVRHVFTGG